MSKKSSAECVECLRFSGTALMFVGAYIAYEGRKLPIRSRRITTYVVGASISSFALWGAWIRPWISAVSKLPINTKILDQLDSKLITCIAYYNNFEIFLIGNNRDDVDHF